MRKEEGEVVMSTNRGDRVFTSPELMADIKRELEQIAASRRKSSYSENKASIATFATHL